MPLCDPERDVDDGLVRDEGELVGVVECQVAGVGFFGPVPVAMTVGGGDE